ncbi:MAG TPA: hypothetical protein VL283_00950 [Candidatus Baltobacteraceae bacterium]|jgi:hypothetical protein|nr:hypothetical protein [Candidatus Baltobacteraceae bacterium]
MRLCEPCAGSRDWVGAAPTAKEVKLRAEGMICQGCGRFATGHPLFRICERCSEKEGRCQHCMKFLTPEAEAEAAKDEAREALIDFFTHCVKTYGIGNARGLFEAKRDELGPAADEVARLDHRDLDGTGQRDRDRERLRRPIWKLVLGPDVYRFRWCADCSMIPRRAPEILKAAQCGHWTTGRSPSHCPVCAAQKNVCEGCGAPTE